MGFKNWIAFSALLSTLWAVIATSTPRSDLNSGAFYIISDCVTPNKEAIITVVSDQISTPGATSFTDFGFPNAAVRLGQETTGTVGAVSRTCFPSYGDTDESSDAWIFSCFDNGAASCTVMIREQ